MQTIGAWLYQYQILLDLLLAVGVLAGLWQWWRAHKRQQNTTFGMERAAAAAEKGQAKLLFRVSMVTLLFVVAITSPWGVAWLGIPTPAPIPTQTPIPVPTAGTVDLPGQPTLEVIFTPTLLPTVTPLLAPTAGCENPKATITSPLPGAILAGQVEVLGNANIDSFGFYTIEISTLGDNWLPVITGSVQSPTDGGVLGAWDASLYEVGNHALRLTVYDTQGGHPEQCLIPITVGR